MYNQMQIPGKFVHATFYSRGGTSMAASKPQETPEEQIYVVISENDGSDWKDETGVRYHYPSRYSKHLKPGSKAIYYKSKMRAGKYKGQRLTKEPHYFGRAIIGRSVKDPASQKGDYFCEILNFAPFSAPVFAKQPGGFIEPIPVSRRSNYWMDGVRRIDESTYRSILGLSDHASLHPEQTMFADLSQDPSSDFESGSEGSRVITYGTKYERNPRIRKQALLIHGYSCQACGFSFEETYGKRGRGYIHVHHLKPLSEVGQEHFPDPRTDFAVLCANCHSIVHRKKDETLAVEEPKSLLRMNGSGLPR